MIAKLFNGKRIAVFSVLTGIILALSVFILPDYRVSTSTEAQDKIFLEDHKIIALDWNIGSEDGSEDDTSYFLKDKFTMEFIFQYKHKRIEIQEESFKNLTFGPLEQIEDSDPRIEHKKLNNEISEMRYIVDVYFLRADPGNTYKLEGMEIEYVSVNTGRSVLHDITPPHTFHVGTYCGYYPSSCQFKLLNDTFEGNTPLFALILKIAAGLMVLAPIALMARWFRERSSQKVKDNNAETHRLIELYERYVADVDVREAEDAGEYMQTLQSLSYKLAEHFFHIHPKDFWENESMDWQTLHEALDAKSRPSGADFQDVRRTITAMKEVFGAEINKHQNKYKKVIGFLRRAKEGR
ncbi:MAG: hypothetical protein R3251_02050 [Candidatus Spechtbacterales bacterium]|nr:hypothetical protein [Candidatus Spechtbacterales bacterium]